MDLKDLIPVYQKQDSEIFSYKFTVFTPVFNCENTIEAVHKSLLNQTYKDFEWLIINDGSTDNSHQTIEDIVQSSPLTINYINNVKNKHKMGCFMQSIQVAKGVFLLTFDGDDECVPEALETFNNEYNSIPEEMKPSVAAVTALCLDQNGNRVGDPFPKDPYYSSTFKSSAIDGIQGEKWGFTKTSVLKGVKIDSYIFSKGLIPESLVWNLISKEGYITKYVNHYLRIYHTEVEGSLSSVGIRGTAFGTSINYIARFNWFFNSNVLKAPIYFLKNLYFMLRASNYSPFKFTDYFKAIRPIVIKVIITLLWPFRKLMK